MTTLPFPKGIRYIMLATAGVFALILGALMFIPPDTFSSLGAGTRSMLKIAVAKDQINGSCLGTPATKWYLPGGLIPINENHCQLRGEVKLTGHIIWYDESRVEVARSHGPGEMPSVDGISYLQVVSGGKALIRLNHCAPFASGNLLDHCY